MAGSITAPTPGPGAYAPPAESSGVYVRSQRPIAPTPTASTTISAATTRPANFNAYAVLDWPSCSTVSTVVILAAPTVGHQVRKPPDPRDQGRPAAPVR